MKSWRGFTVVEMVVTILILSVLLAIGGMAFVSAQKNARDNDRTSDIDTIARTLENYYKSNQSSKVGYPPTSKITSGSEFLRQLDLKSLRSPNQNSGISLLSASSNAAQNPNIDQYIYQPLNRDGDLCSNENEECSSFKIFYKLEKSNEILTKESIYQ